MPSDLLLKAMNLTHRCVMSLTRGRAGWTAAGMPVISLTTTGRRTGQRRSVLLTVPLRQGDNLVVVGSRGGDDTTPAWVLNLQADRVVEVAVQGRPAQPMRARVATAHERAELWPQVVADHSFYADYQLRTERQIPLVILEPAVPSTDNSLES